LPHIVLHELEAWVYAAPTQLDSWMFEDDAHIVKAISDIAASHNTPEDIDEGPQTAPSKQLVAAFAKYRKVLHGPIAIRAIGIDLIRATCPHFAQWLQALEVIARR
jgi:hypothetical protein